MLCIVDIILYNKIEKIQIIMKIDSYNLLVVLKVYIVKYKFKV